jgi:hypothetical protein
MVSWDHALCDKSYHLILPAGATVKRVRQERNDSLRDAPAGTTQSTALIRKPDQQHMTLNYQNLRACSATMPAKEQRQHQITIHSVFSNRIPGDLRVCLELESPPGQCALLWRKLDRRTRSVPIPWRWVPPEYSTFRWHAGRRLWALNLLLLPNCDYRFHLSYENRGWYHVTTKVLSRLFIESTDMMRMDVAGDSGIPLGKVQPIQGHEDGFYSCKGSGTPHAEFGLYRRTVSIADQDSPIRKGGMAIEGTCRFAFGHLMQKIGRFWWGFSPLDNDQQDTGVRRTQSLSSL